MKKALETFELLHRNLALNGVTVHDFRENWQKVIFEAIEELKKDSLKIEKLENDVKDFRVWVNQLSDQLDEL